MLVEYIPRLYEHCQAILVCPGPSLTEGVAQQVNSVKDKYVIIGVGDAYKRLDYMDEHYACDARWWRVHGEKINEKHPHVRKWCHDEEGEKYGCWRIKGDYKDGLSTDPSKIHYGSNSGYQALNLAYLWGCSKLILVGYNMKTVGGQSHFFKGRDPTLSLSSPYPSFVKKYQTIQKDIKEKIVNCTENSALTFFKQASLESIL